MKNPVSTPHRDPRRDTWVMVFVAVAMLFAVVALGGVLVFVSDRDGRIERALTSGWRADRIALCELRAATPEVRANCGAAVRDEIEAVVTTAKNGK